MNYSPNIFIKKYFKIIALIIVIFSAFISIYSLIQAVKWIERPFPGFLLYRNLIVAEVSLSHWTGHKGDLKSYDKIVDLEGRRISSADEVYSIVTNEPIGTPINYTISRDNKLITLTIPTMKFELVDFLLIFSAVYFVGVVFLIIGILVYYLKPNLDSSKVFLMACFSIGFWFISIFDTQSTYSLYNIPFLGLVIAPAFFIHLAFVFPSKKKDHSIILFSYLLCFLLVILHIVYFNSQNIWARTERLFWLYVLFSASIFLRLTISFICDTSLQYLFNIFILKN